MFALREVDSENPFVFFVGFVFREMNLNPSQSAYYVTGYCPASAGTLPVKINRAID